MNTNLVKLTAAQKQQFENEGYLIVRKLFHAEELAEIERTFEEMSHTRVPGYFEPVLDQQTADPLKRYPRVMHPHRFNHTAMRYMIHPQVMSYLAELYGEEPLAAQSMFYYKPPGSRGQALHQDNFYLKVEPGTCIAAWTAIDATDEENGCLRIVPHTHREDIACPEEADPNESFTIHLVKPPEGKQDIPVIMGKGDVLFFNGSLIHGSYRNRSAQRFRRAFICHYASASTTRIGGGYKPLFRADGTEVEPESNMDSGPCGVEFPEAQPH